MYVYTYVVEVAGQVYDVLPLVQLRLVLLGGTLVLLVGTAARLVTRAWVTLVPTTTAALQEGRLVTETSHTHVHVVSQRQGPVCGGEGGSRGWGSGGERLGGD